MPETLLEIQNISKHFPGVDALRDVSFDIHRNTVHCIVGENGAGKSTLIKILTGAERRSGGTILLQGQGVQPAQHAGGHELGHERPVPGAERRQPAHRGAEPGAGQGEGPLGLLPRDAGASGPGVRGAAQPRPRASPCSRRVGELCVAQKQVIEIAKAIASESELIIMDEPTAALSEEEVKRLFAIIKELKRQNVTVIYISHRLREIFEIGDAVTVLRDGQMIGTREVSELAAPADGGGVLRGADQDDARQGRGGALRRPARRTGRLRGPGAAGRVSTAKLQEVSFELFKGRDPRLLRPDRLGQDRDRPGPLRPGPDARATIWSTGSRRGAWTPRATPSPRHRPGAGGAAQRRACSPSCPSGRTSPS